MTDLFKAPEDNQENVDFNAWVKEKYGDDEVAAKKALYHANKHIERIEKENNDARDEINKRITMEEMLAKIEASRTSPITHNDGERETPASNPNVSIEEIEARLEAKMAEKLQQSKQQDIAKANVDYCAKELEKAWGPDFRNKTVKVLQELGIDQKTMEHMAETNPKLFLKAMVGGTATSSSHVTPPKSSFGSAPSTGNGERDYAYYEKLRKEKGNNYYWRRDIQDQLVKDMNRLGDAFNLPKG